MWLSKHRTEPFIVVRLTFAGSLLGALSSWLMSRLRGGFLMVHWGLYAWLAPLFWSG